MQFWVLQNPEAPNFLSKGAKRVLDLSTRLAPRTLPLLAAATANRQAAERHRGSKRDKGERSRLELVARSHKLLGRGAARSVAGNVRYRSRIRGRRWIRNRFRRDRRIARLGNRLHSRCAEYAIRIVLRSRQHIELAMIRRGSRSEERLLGSLLSIRRHRRRLAFGKQVRVGLAVFAHRTSKCEPVLDNP
ncbi:hypothetical protein C1879_00170 [Paraeggerthella hongkongensis]|nr:hypothetical protein C1879_00170 [Paraeggerthella hongkongensis]